MNRKQLFTAFAAMAATLSLHLPLVQAQNEQVPREHRFGRAVPAAGFINRDVVTQAGKNVGQIEDVILDLESGRILFVALNPKGSGQGDMVAVPPTLFALPANQQAAARQAERDKNKDRDNEGVRARATRRPLTIKANEQAITGAPKFAGTGEELARGEYVDKVYEHFNQPRWWAGAAGSKAGSFNHIRRASQASNFTVENPSNEKLGKVETILFDIPAGRVSYVVLDPQGSIANKQLLIPVPPMAFTRGQEARMLVLDADKEKLNNAPAIDRNQLTAEDIQKLSDPAFAAKVYNYYGKQPWFQTDNVPTPTGP